MNLQSNMKVLNEEELTLINGGEKVTSELIAKLKGLSVAGLIAWVGSNLAWNAVQALAKNGYSWFIQKLESCEGSNISDVDWADGKLY